MNFPSLAQFYTMKKLIFLAVLAIIISTQATAQTFSAFLREAENSFAQKDYYAALFYFSEAVDIEPDRADVLYKYAESARLFDAFSLADSLFQQVRDIDTLATKEYPLATFYQAGMKKRLGEYDAAQSLFSQYLTQNPNSTDDTKATAQEEIDICGWAIEMLAEPDRTIDVSHAGNAINTAYSEFANAKHAGKFYYTSFSFTKDDDNHNPKRPYMKSMYTEDGTTPNIWEAINDNARHIAHATYNADGTYIYYSVCEYVSSAEVKCALYSRTVIDENTFGDAKKLPANINLEGFTTTQPQVGLDEATGKNYLYFVSDRPEGKGGLDVWASEIKKDTLFENPENLSINTAADDISPFFDASKQVLYFSSEGRKSFGGFDIYRTSNDGTGWTTPENMGAPLNSSFHDIHYSVTEGGSQGFLSSNRKGALHFEKVDEFCCFDIYNVNSKVVTLDLFTFDAKTDEALNGATVKVIKIYPDGTEEEIFVANERDKNDYHTTLDRGFKYKITAEKDGYVLLEEAIDLSDLGVADVSVIKKDLKLIPNEIDLMTLVIDADTKEPLLDANVQLFVDGNPIATDNHIEDNEYPYTLQRDKIYTLISFKAGYRPDTIIIDLPALGNPMTLERILELKIKDIEEFPPLYLYFDNDSPDPRVMRETTTKTYAETYTPYYGKRELFKSEYVAFKEGREKFVSEQIVKAFFEREVKNSYESLLVFCEKLDRLLGEKMKIEIVIRGYTSPRASAAYNLALGKRRVQCLRNHFETYGGGVLKKYIDSGQLVLTEVSYGESQVPPEVAARLEDERDSIYSPLASAERRVEIIGIALEDQN